MSWKLGKEGLTADWESLASGVSWKGKPVMYLSSISLKACPTVNTCALCLHGWAFKVIITQRQYTVLVLNKVKSVLSASFSVQKVGIGNDITSINRVGVLGVG